MNIGDKVRIDTGIGYAVEGRIIAIFQREDAPIRVSLDTGAPDGDGKAWGDYYESEIEVIA